MLRAPVRQEIDHRTIKLVVGVIALTLALLTQLFSRDQLTSISASYWEGGWSQSIFTGFLFAIAAFLLAYNGMTWTEMALGKIAALAAAGVALFPCACGTHTPPVPFIHGTSAAVMFVILAYFSYGFYRRAVAKGHAEARVRAGIYAVCTGFILVSIVALAIDHFFNEFFSAAIPRFVFYGEACGLVSFGISWLVASRVLPLLTREDERFSLFG